MQNSGQNFNVIDLQRENAIEFTSAVSATVQKTAKAEMHHTSHLLEFAEYLRKFRREDVQEQQFSPRENDSQGVKPFGMRKAQVRKKDPNIL